MKKLNFVLVILFLLNVNYYSKQNTDSLNIEKLKKMEVKLESLSSTIEKEKIAKDYFSSILSSQTTIFSIIITIAIFVISLINFVNLKKYYENKLLLQNQKFEKLLEEQNDNYESTKTKLLEEINTIKVDIENTEDITNRAIYTFLKFNKGYILAIVFATKIASLRLKNNNIEETIIFLKNAREDVDLLEDKEIAKKYAHLINERLNDYENSDNKEIKILAQEIRVKFNQFCWS